MVGSGAGARLLAGEELAERVERASHAFVRGWAEAAAAAPGNPLGVEVRRFGAATAVARPGLPELGFMNTVYGLRPADAGQVPAIMAFYAERGLRPGFELVPAPGFSALAQELHAHGCGQVGFHAALAGRTGALAADAGAPPPAGVAVEPVERAELPLFADLLLAGHGVDEDARRLERVAVERWRSMGGLRLYLARVDGEPAAAAALRLADDVALLANAATLPEHRGRGCQTALVRRRLADAAAAGCELVAALAGFGSASQRTLERAGLRLAYLIAVWRRYPDEPSRASAG